MGLCWLDSGIASSELCVPQCAIDHLGGDTTRGCTTGDFPCLSASMCIAVVQVGYGEGSQAQIYWSSVLVGFIPTAPES